MNDDGAAVLIWRFIWIYIDDSALGSNKVVTMVFLLEVVFIRLKKYGYTIRVPKCIFIVLELKWCGYIVGDGIVKPDPKRTAMITKLPDKPDDRKQLKHFLQVTGWHLRRFAPEYPQAAAKLSFYCMRKPKSMKQLKEIWNEELQKAYDTIKECCKRELLNNTFDPDCKDTKLWIDWSREGMAAVLTQNDRLIRVWGRACSDCESRYNPTKGELKIFTEAQLKFKYLLMSLKDKFLIITDHRPLLGIERKLNLENDQLATERLKTEDFRNRRNLVYVRGDRQLADFWTRKIWPNKPVDYEPDGPAVFQLDFSNEDFKPDSEEIADLEARQKKYGLIYKDCGTHIEVKTGNQWRVFTPEKSRRILLLDKHAQDHAGAVELIARLQGYYWATKREDIQTFLRSCMCQRRKPHISPRNESQDSKNASKIDAKEYLDHIHIDIYTYDGIRYMTIQDVATDKTWVRKLMGVGAAAGNPGALKRKITSEYMLWEAELYKKPKQIGSDKQTAIHGIPGNVIPNPSYRPQMIGKLERMHEELGKLCRIHNSTPDKVYHYLKANETFDGLEGGVVMDEDVNQMGPKTCIWSQCDKEPQPGLDKDGLPNRACCKDHLRMAKIHYRSKVPYDGRQLKVGQLVRQKINPRLRTKKDEPWSTPCRVVRKLGKKTYEIITETRHGKNPQKHIDDLKEFDVGDRFLKDCKLTDEIIEDVTQHIDWRNADLHYKNLDVNYDDDWKKKTVYVGYPGLKKMKNLVTKLESRKYKTVYAVFPELKCETWWEPINDCQGKWYISDFNEDKIPIWEDADGRKITNMDVDWCIVRFDS